MQVLTFSPQLFSNSFVSIIHILSKTYSSEVDTVILCTCADFCNSDVTGEKIKQHATSWVVLTYRTLFIAFP